MSDPCSFHDTYNGHCYTCRTWLHTTDHAPVWYVSPGGQRKCHICLKRYSRLYYLAHAPGAPRTPKATPADLAEDLEWLLGCGVSVTETARRVGYANPRSLSRRLYRVGRPDLAAIFGRKAA